MHCPPAFVSIIAPASAALIGCGGSDLTLPEIPGTPASITVVTGNGQEAPAGAPLPSPLIVKVSDIERNPLPAQPVVFTLAEEAPGAELSPDASLSGTRTQVSDANGRAEFTDLVINGTGGAHVLIFAANGYASATSRAINVRVARGGGGDDDDDDGDEGGRGGGNDDRDDDDDDRDDDEDDRDGNRGRGGGEGGGGSGRGGPGRG